MGTLAGCSIFERQPCAAVYLPSGVTFDLTHVVDPAAGGTVRLCTDDRCEDWDVATGDVRTPFVTVDDVDTEQAVTVSVRITDATGSAIFDGSGTADLTQYPPDGPVCQEDLYRATVRADADGTLTTIE